MAVARGRGRGRGDWSVGTPGGMQEITYTVPADKCGLVIGKGGFGIQIPQLAILLSEWSCSCCLTVKLWGFL